MGETPHQPGRKLASSDLASLSAFLRAGVEVRISIVFRLIRLLKKIGPKKSSAERRHVLRVAADVPKISGQASIWVVFELRDGGWNFGKRYPMTVVVVRMAKRAIVEISPERLLGEPREVDQYRDQDLRDFFIPHGPGEVMIVGKVVTTFRPDDRWNHMPAQEIPTLLSVELLPTFLLLSDLVHAHGDLGRTQIGDSDRVEDGFERVHV